MKNFSVNTLVENTLSKKFTLKYSSFLNKFNVFSTTELTGLLIELRERSSIMIVDIDSDKEGPNFR